MKKRFNLKEQEGETSEEELYDSLGPILELATTMCNDHENETYDTLDPHEALDCLHDIDTPRAHRLIEMIKFYEGELDSMGAREDYRDDDEYMDEYGEDELPDWMGESKKIIKLKESDLHKIVKRVLNENWFNRKKQIDSFQDYDNYMSGTDVTIRVWEDRDNFYIGNVGEMGDENITYTLSKTKMNHKGEPKYNKENVTDFAKTLSKEEQFATNRR